MCGVTGIYTFGSNVKTSLHLLEAATDKLNRRGPDAGQIWNDETVGLGHRRLSIIDTSSVANQPMQDASGRYTIVFNGEIYNYQSIKKELLEKGITFKTESDTEVLLYAYIVWGEGCMPRLNGFFAFAIYDSLTKNLFLARDRYGIKPLYYYQDTERLIFASELKSIIAYQIPKEIDKEAMKMYFQLTYIPSPNTVFKQVKKLAPGKLLKIQEGKVEIKTYYQIPFQEKPSISSYEDAKKSLENALRASVHRRLVADVPLGAFLSGGIDSSIIVALASEKVKDLKTYSIGFKDNKYFDETEYAQLVADKYKTDHHVFSLTNDDLLNCVEDVLDYLDEPFADSSALPVFILSQMTRKHVTVALSGDGADEVFSGYNKHTAWLMSHEKSTSNKLIGALSPLWKALPKSRYTGVTDTVRKLNKYADLLNSQEKGKYWFLASFVADKKIKRLITPEWAAEENLYDAYKKEQMNGVSHGEMNEVLLTDSKMVLEGDMLTKVDRMSMANGLEVRVPFLDPEVVQLAFDMPAEFKISKKYRKIVLREAFRKYLPEELFTRPKHGFEVPLLGWFKEELAPKLNDLVFNQERIVSQGIFEWEEIKRIKQKLYSLDPGDVHIQIWSLLVFQNWYDNYFAD